MKASWLQRTFHFKFQAKTSREVLSEKHSWFLILENEGRKGIGECSIIESLNPETPEEIERKLDVVCQELIEGNLVDIGLSHAPSVKFGLEMALKDLEFQEAGILFPSEFTKGKKAIPINGLVWMADIENMSAQIQEKLDAGFDCIKLKIGAYDTDEELNLIRSLRKKYPADQIEIRVDANGAFSPEKARWVLEELSDLEVHSIEQPIRQGHWKEMADLCANSPLPIALDEELIGVTEPEERKTLIQEIRPQYLILKPSLIGGFSVAEHWIELAKEIGCGWWATSALEANIGLNAIAQWVFTQNSEMLQGLGTGQLYTDNIPSPLGISSGQLHYDPTQKWNFEKLTGNVD